MADVATIVDVVAAHFGVTPRAILGKSRERRVVLPRHVAMWLARDLTTLSFPELGRAFGGRDHTTVYHAVWRIGEALQHDAVLATRVQHIREGLGNPLPDAAQRLGVEDRFLRLVAERDVVVAENARLRAQLAHVRAVALALEVP